LCWSAELLAADSGMGLHQEARQQFRIDHDHGAVQIGVIGYILFPSTWLENRLLAWKPKRDLDSLMSQPAELLRGGC
jgi:ABC-type nitrate/sulfonate/bicarbonate transport system permease component